MMMRKRTGVVAAFVLVVTVAGCGKKGGPGQSATPPQGSQKPAASTPAAPSMPDYAKMAQDNREKLTQMNQGKTIEAVPAATLKEILPAELPGMKRTNASAEKNESMGFNVSTAEAQYDAADGNADISVKLTDVGNMSGPMRMGMAGWALAQFNRETDNGYEKTTTYNGYKAYEEYNTQDKRGALRVWVADRFMVEVEGSGVTMDTLKQAMGKIDLKKLAATGS